MENTNIFVKVYKDNCLGEGETEMIININDIATVQKTKNHVEIKLLNGHYITVLADFDKITEAINPKIIEKSGSGNYKLSIEKNTI